MPLHFYYCMELRCGVLFENGGTLSLLEDKKVWNKCPKYAHVEESHYFVPVAVEALGVFGPEAHSFLQALGHRIANATQDQLSNHYLRQGISVAVQRGNAAAILGTDMGPDYGAFSAH